MANALIAQGTINRLLANVVYTSFPVLNVISSFLGKEGISITFEGEASQLIPTMTAGVPSPEPYQMATVTIHLVRSQGMASIYKNQFETNTYLGSTTVIPDTLGLTPYQFENCVLKSVAPLSLNGTQADFSVTFQGIYRLNSNLFLAA